MKVEKGSRWRDDDSRIRSGKWPERTGTVVAVDDKLAAVKWDETGTISEIGLARFGRRGRLMPLLSEPQSLGEVKPLGIPTRETTYPALEAVKSIVSRNASQFADWQALSALLPAAILEARISEREECLSEIQQAFTLKGGVEYIRRGLETMKPSKR